MCVIIFLVTIVNEFINEKFNANELNFSQACRKIATYVHVYGGLQVTLWHSYSWGYIASLS